MLRLVRSFAADQSGAAGIEYGLVVALIAVTIIGVIATLGLALRDRANEIATAIANAGR